MRHVAIIGSGPAGYYTAEACQKQFGDAVRVDIVDRLPVPYGLIRTGVAPDHQSIKGVSRRYETTALSDNVRFVGNVTVGRDVTIAELVERYDAVVLATGAPADRALGIPGDDLPGVIGSAAFVGWYNGHPDFADLDLDRGPRRGYPEAVFCLGKTAEQVALIAAEVGRQGVRTLFTRADPAHARAVLAELPDAAHDPASGLLAWPPDPPPATGGRVLVLAAGTADQPVAREALLTARHLGRDAELIMDVGVAGLHRVLGRLDALRAARVIVVVAGMDGALPAVVAGLVAAPVVAVPTSTGYGAAFEGVAALLTMLNSCSPGVGVVNIDNGYGAGHLAAQIAAPG